MTCQKGTLLDVMTTYTCRHIPTPLTLTGRLTDPLWQSAAKTELTDPVTGLPHPDRVTAQLLYSDTHLYIGFTCAGSYIYATLKDHDAAVWTEDCVEVFLCPSGKIRQYYEINLNPLNTVFDTFILNGRPESGEGWAITSFVEAYTCKGLETAVFVDGELGKPGARGWSAEYAIPFTSIIGADTVIPRTGDQWRMNLCRIDQPENGQKRHYSWATIGKIDFHQPWHFGTLTFG